MAIVHGQIESLKKLKNELNSRNIYRFKSVKEINEFIKCGYTNEKEAIRNNHRHLIHKEIQTISEQIILKESDIVTAKELSISNIKAKIISLKAKISALSIKVKKNLIYKLIYNGALKKCIKELTILEENPTSQIERDIRNLNKAIQADQNSLNLLTQNQESEIEKRSAWEIKELNRIKDVINEFHPLLLGAIGENMVVKEISKLSDEFILINDYSREFNPPIFNKNTNDRIYSIQIDHLLISRSGVFILETKNWSKKSIESYDLRSPVDQILRTSFALFVLLNNDDFKFQINDHHWGKKQIPIRNLIVMINEKPKGDFKYVKVKTLNEINSYISFFDEVFSMKEVENITNFLLKNQ